MIRTIIEPNVQKKFTVFARTAPPFSIALDGYVRGPPRLDLTKPIANFNHHEDVDRLSTSSTSSQVYLYIKQALFKRFSVDKIPEAILHFNDPDQDSSLARWLFYNSDRFTGLKSEPLLSRLLFAEDMLDRTGGTYPFPLDSDLIRDIAWIFESYNTQMARVRKMGASEMETIMDGIGARIDKYLLGQGRQVAPDDSFEMMHMDSYKGEGWAMIGKVGPFARTRLFNSGTYACIVHKGERDDGRHDYAVSRMSSMIDWPVKGFFRYMNDVEGIAQNADDRWDGGNDIGGSPMMMGSSRNPDQIVENAREYLESQEKAA